MNQRITEEILLIYETVDQMVEAGTDPQYW